MQIVDDRQARVPHLGHELADPLHGLGVFHTGKAAVAADGQDGEVLLVPTLT